MTEADLATLRARRAELRATADRHWTLRHLAVAVAAAAVVIAAAAVVHAVSTPGDRAEPRHRVPRRMSTSTVRPVPPTATEPVNFRDGVLEVGGVRYQIGQTGDEIVLGDWDCDGRDTVALHRGGWIYRFDAWATGVAELTPAAAGPGTVEGTVSAEDLDGDGCDDVVVRSGSEAARRIELRAVS